MPTSERESALARRLRELEEEERRVRQTMKDVNRKLRRLERGAPVALEPRPPMEAQPLQTPSPRDPEQPLRPATGAVTSTPRLGPSEDKRFANYFASGSFVKPRPLGRERRVQRNKAIFLLMFALLMAYLVYHLVF